MTTDSTNTTSAQPAAPNAEAPGEERARLWDEMAKADATGAAKAEPAVAAVDTTLPGDKAAGDPPAAAPAADIWANASPETKAAYEALNTNYKRVSGTVSAQQKKINALQRQPAATPATGQDTKTGSTAAPATGAGPASAFDTPAFKKAKSEYAEVLEPIEAALRPLEEMARRNAEDMKGFTAAQQEQHVAEQYQLVIDAHPDYQKVAKTPEFLAWYEQAPQYKRAGVERNAKHIVDGPEVIALVKDFKADTGFTTPSAAPAAPAAGGPSTAAPDQRQRQLASAAAPRAKGPQAARGGIPEDREGAWNYYAARDREAAQTQGQNR